MILDPEVEGMKQIAKNYSPLQTIKIYKCFTDRYIDKHIEQLKTIDQEDYLRLRAKVFERYVGFYYSNQAVIKRELKEF